MKTIKIIVAGGRNFNDYELLKDALDLLLMFYVELGYEIVIISGTAKGADKLGERYAKERNYKLIRMPADWDKYGKAAGYRRIVDMANIEKPFEQIVTELVEAGNEIGVQVKCQREEIFNKMHRI